jgi:phosphotransferase system enzyme I (PtsI)
VSGGDIVIIDGNHGVVIVGPDPDTLRKYQRLEHDFHVFEEKLEELIGLPAETLDGFAMNIMANIEFPNEIDLAVKNGASGVGLYRTEFLFLQNMRLPTEKEHFETYVESVKALGTKPIVIRTMDLGPDKFGPEVGISGERNPFMGCRSIRYCLENPDVFRSQLRAILRASAFGDVRILFPMISKVAELRQSRKLLEEAKKELSDQGASFNPDIPVGVLVEVPAAALTADILARECDFFSIGTNDLIQYSIAVDRDNERVAQLFNPTHPAVLRLISSIIDAASAANIPVAMCGEMAGDVLYSALLVGMGLETLSVSPFIIPEIKKVIRSITRTEAEEIARTVSALDSGDEGLKFLTDKARELLPEVFG